MDEEENARQLKLLLIGVVAFCASLYFSWTELRYAIWSYTATADVVSVREKKNSEDSPRQVVECGFTDADGQRQQSKLEVSADAPIQEGGRIEIRYLATTPPTVRLAEERNWFPFVMLLISTIGLGWFLRAMHATANA